MKLTIDAVDEKLDYSLSYFLWRFMNTLEFYGVHRVTFVNNESKVINIVRPLFTTDAVPMLLIGEDGVIYNWNNVLFIEPLMKE